MEFVLLAALYLFVLIWPVRFAARAVGARRDGYLMCFFAIIVVGFINSLMSNMNLGGETVTSIGLFLAFFIVSGILYMMILETTFKGGVVITLIQAVLTTLFGLVFSEVIQRTMS